jgi:hypothetical protein
VPFLLSELSAMVQKSSLAKQLSLLWFLDDFLSLRRSPSSSLLLELEVEYAELESTSLAPTIARAFPQISFFLVLMLALVIALVVALPPVLAIRLRLVVVAVLVLNLLGAVSDEVSRLSCSLTIRLVRSANSSSPSTSNSSSGIDIKEDKENILVDGLALVFPFEPPMRARL